jgi:hypothetical protein
MSKILSKRYAAHISFDFAHDVSPEEVTHAILRAVQTAAFAIPGRVVVDLVTPQDDVPMLAKSLPIGKLGP